MGKSSEKRLAQRLYASLTVKYTLPNGFSGRIISSDVSVTGVCLLLPQKLEIGVTLTLAIRMPRKNRETVIYGEVTRQQKSEDPKKEGYITGINFSKADPLDIEELITTVRSGHYFIPGK